MRYQTFWLKVLLCLLICSSAGAQVNKCTVEGKTVYQQQPCAGGSSPVNLSGAGKADPHSSASNYWLREALRQKHEEDVLTAVARGQVFTGMTTEETRRSWGAPSKINSTVTGNSTSEQWVYRRAGIGYDQYIYFTNGLVTSMQGSR